MPSIINSDNGVSSGSAGLKTTGGNDGLLDFQSSGTRIAGITTSAFQVGTNNISAENSLSFRNRFINGGMAIDQRNSGASQTITAAAALAYTVDRWYAYCTGANVTGQRIAGSGPDQFAYRFTGAASVTKIGFAQRIESFNSYDLNNTTATLSVDLANSLLTTVTWTAWYANTANTFGTLASPTRTQIATGTFTVTSTLTRYSTTISIPSAATTGIEIEFSVGAQTSGTWTIENAQLEAGSVATPFERRPYGTELNLCERYYQINGVLAATAPTATLYFAPIPSRTPMRAAPTATLINGTNKFIDPTVATRSISTLTSISGANSLGYFAEGACTSTTVNRFHILLADTFAASAEL